MTTIVQDWTRESERIALVLEIDGLAERFYSHADPGVSSPYVARPGLLVGRGGTVLESSRFDLAQMIADGGGATVKIADTGPIELGGNGAASALLRMGANGATSATRLAADVASQAPGAALASLTVADNSAFAGAGYLWIGQECLSYTGVSGSTLFTGLTRGQLGTQASAHFVVDSGGFAPLVTSECVAFRGRRARLLGYVLRDDGSVANAIDLVRGFIDQPPRLDADGVTITVTLAPDVARLKNKLPGYGVAQETTVSRGVHVFSDGYAGRARASIVMPLGAGIDVVDIWASAGAGGAGTIEVTADQIADAAAIFDPTFASGDVRRGVIETSGSDLSEINAFATAPPRNEIQTSGAWAAQENRRARNPILFDYIEAVFHDGSTSPEVLAWPSALIDKVNADWSPGTYTSPNGRWADIRLEAGGTRLALTPNVPARALVVNIVGGIPQEQGNVDAVCVVGIQPQSPNEPGGYGPVGRRWIPERGNRFDPGPDSQGRAVVPMVGCPLAFYQHGERRITLDDDVFGGVLPAQLELQGTHPSGDQVRQTVGVSAINSHAAPDGRTVYSYTLTENTAQVRFNDEDWQAYPWPVSMVDFDAPIVARPMVALAAVTMPVAVGQILASAHGDNVRGTYDVLHDGLGMDTSQLDQSSIVAAGNGPPGLSSILTRFDRDDPKEVADVVGPLARSFGNGITQGIDRLTGARLVRLVQIVRPSAARANDSLVASDFTADATVESMVDDEIVNALTFMWSDDHPGVEFRDADSIPRHGGEAQSQEEKLSGLAVSSEVVDLRSVFVPISTRRFALLSNPRRVFRGTLPLGRAMLLALGDVVELTHADVIDYDGSRGVTSAACLVTAIAPSLENGTADIELVYYGARVGGFAPSLRVIATPAVDEITVAANVYTLAREPLTGQTVEDLDFFDVGDTVLLRPATLPGGWPTGYTRTIIALDRTTRIVTLSAAHGLAAGDRVRSPSYSSSSTDSQKLSHFGSTATGLVVAGVALYEHE